MVIMDDVSKGYHIIVSGQTDDGKELEEDFTVTEGDYEKYNKGDQFDYEAINKEQD